MSIQAYYRGYQRMGIAKVHILRTTTKRSYRGRRGAVPSTGPESWCGQSARDHTNSPTVSVDPAKLLADGLEWCGRCIGPAIEHAGLLDQAVTLLLTHTKAAA